MFERPDSQNHPRVFPLLLLALCAVGLVNLYSISQSSGLAAFKKQLAWTVAGMAVMTFLGFLKPAVLRRYSFHVYAVSLALLLLVLAFGKTVAGSQSWFQIGWVAVQPSEFMKIAMILVLASYYGQDVPVKPSYGLRDIVKPLVFVAAPVGAVVLQPDMGTCVALLLVGASMILIAGVRRQTLAKMAIAAAVFALPAWHFMVKEYQKERIYSFMDLSSDELGAGYNSIQSQIAIGSGGAYGKGFLLGSQSNLRFLPAHTTDFAFSVLAEEWGFAGSIFALLLYFSIILLILDTATSLEDRFATMACFGVAALFFWHGLVNFAMITGLFPIIGIPLFFVSYGGSATVTAFAGIGIVLCLRKR